MVKVFANGLEGRGSILDWIIPKTEKKRKKKVTDDSLLNTQHFKLWIKSKRSNPRKIQPTYN